MQRSRLLQLTLGLAVLLMLGATWTALADCQYCWTGSPSGGQCQDVVNPSPSIATLENCQGGLKCRRGEFGTICWPDCIGDPCYWV